jgi:hypothetical protein
MIMLRIRLESLTGDIISQVRTLERKMERLEILAGKSTAKVIAAKTVLKNHQTGRQLEKGKFF